MPSVQFKVLIVDDSRALRTLLKEILIRERITSLIYEAEDGKKGIEMFEQIKPDLVIMDLMMPGLNGLQCIKILRKRDPSVRILVLTGSHSTVDTKEAITYGAMDVVYKPFVESELVRKIYNQLKYKLSVDEKANTNNNQISNKISKLDHRLKILICEDEIQVGNMYKRALDIVGHRSVLTHTGESCMAEFKRAMSDWPFDVVLLDYKLPNMDGSEVANRIRTLNPNQTIIFISGYGNLVLEKIGKTNDEIIFLTKPVSVVNLIEKIEESEMRKQSKIHQ